MADPRFSEVEAVALLDDAMAAHQQGRLDEADGLYQRVLQAQPDNAQALRLRGILSREQGNLRRSVKLLKKATEMAPDNTEPLNELGLTYMAVGDLQPAEAALRGAITRNPESIKALANLGAVLQYRGHLGEAIACYRQALELEPTDLEVRCNLANTLLDAGQGDSAVDECDRALELAPNHPFLLAAKGAVLAGLEQFEPARELLEQAVARNPGDDMAMINLAYAERRLNRLDAAIAVLRQAVGLNSDNARATADLVNLLAATAHGQDALHLAESFLRCHPGERLVLAAYAFALADGGRREAARGLLDYEALIRVVDVEAPDGYADLDAFNHQLASVIQAHPSLLMSPVSKATRGGGQTGELNFYDEPALAALESLFRETVDKLGVELAAGEFAEHPAMAYAAESWVLRAWGTVLQPGGRQTPHMHPLGWFSGVYYVSLATDMTGSQPQAGWLEFGAPPARLIVSEAPELHLIEPHEGRLVLFPSYFYHRTRPFQSPEPRISIAFDVVPKAL